MNVIKNITINLTAEDVKEIIAKYVRENMQCNNVTVDDVTLSIGTRSVGYGPMEHDEVYFREATVKCKLEDERT
jgi:hypothetical protein